MKTRKPETVTLKVNAAELDSLVVLLVASVESETYLTTSPNDASPAGVVSSWKRGRPEFIENSIKAGCSERSARSLFKMIEEDAALLERLVPLLPKALAS